MPRLDDRTLKDGQWVKPGRTPLAPGTGTPSTDTPQYAFNMPTLPRGSKFLLAHQFVPYPRLQDSDTMPDYISNNFDPPGTGTHAAYGGYIRNRLVPRYTPTGLGDPAYRIKDMEWEILEAVDGGLDGFTIDILSGRTQQRGIAVTNFITAMKNVAPSYFKICLMPDGSSWNKNVTAEVAADDCAAWIKQAPDVHLKINGQYVIAPYGPEFVNGATASNLTYWTAFKNRLLNTHGFNVLMWFCFSKDFTNTTWGADDLDPIAYGHGRWGVANPISALEPGNTNAGAPAYAHARYGKPWMHYARPQDTRPSTDAGRVWWEAGNTDLLRNCWTAAIDGGAEAVQNTTWNDFYEDSGVGTSVLSGKCWMDVQAYWLAKYKTGSFPTIVRDTLYLSHRNQFTSVDSTAEVQSTAQTLFMNQLEATTCPARNEIEVLVFSTASAQVHVYANGVQIGATETVPAGVTAVKRPLTLGNITAVMKRSSVDVAGTSVATREAVVAKPLVQSRTYMLSSSRRVNY